MDHLSYTKLEQQRLVGVLSGRVVGLSSISGRVESGFLLEMFDPQPDPIRSRVVGFGLLSGRVVSGRVIRVYWVA